MAPRPRLTLSPPDAQLLAALLPRIQQHRDLMVSSVIARARGDKLTTEALWRHVGGLITLHDLEASLRGELTQAEKDLSNA